MAPRIPRSLSVFSKFQSAQKDNAATLYQRLVACGVIVSLNLPAVSGAMLYPQPGSAPDWNRFNDSPWKPRSNAPRLLSPANAPFAKPGKDEPWQPGAITEGNDVPLAPPDGVNPSGPFIPGMSLPAGTCAIAGEISDTTSLNAVAGAYVDVLGTGRTAQTDSNGKFRIEGLPPGTYTIEASKLGYSSETSSTTVADGQIAEVRLGLRAKPADDSANEYALEEETIVGEYQGDGSGSLQLDLMETPSIASGISKDDFTRSGISDAASAVSKISGANIVGGKYAVVRGLGDRYSNTLVNGAQISSADPSKKAVQLDLFPSDLLESVAIYKTFTPDLPAEFAGGTVAIQTLRFPEERVLELEVGTAWNSNLSGNEMRTIEGREFDFWGNTDDKLPPEVGDPVTGLPVGYTGARPLDRATAAQRQAAAEAAAAWQALHASAPMHSGKRGAQAATSLTLTYADTFKPLENLQLGAVFAFTREQSDKIREDVEIGRFFNPGTSSPNDDRLDRSGTEDQYTAALNWGMLGSLGAKVGENHQVGFTWFKNSSSEDQVNIGNRQRRQDGDKLDYLPSNRTPGGAGAYVYTGYEVQTPLQRDLELFQLDGSHKFGDAGFKLDWSLSQSDALESRPHSRGLFYYQLDYTDPRIQEVQGDIYRPELGILETAADVVAAGAGTLESFRESLSTKENANNARIDLTIPVFHNDEDHFFNFKLGANRFARDREVRGRFFTYNIPLGLNGDLLDPANNGQAGADYLAYYDSIFGPDGEYKFDGWRNLTLAEKLIIIEATKSGRTVRNVDAGSEVTATYLMADFHNGPWTIVGGARIEDASRSYQVLAGLNSPTAVNPEPVEVDAKNVLPGITINRTFGVDEKVDLNFAWSRTIARPTFYEFAPVQTEDQATGETIVGNQNLTDTLIDNYDLQASWRPDTDTLFSVGLFHKSMENPIAQAYDLTKKTWVNGTQGSLQGAEIEGRYRFGEFWTLGGNYTYINSLLEYEQSGQLIESSYEGQPENIFNLILGFDHQDSGYSASLVYNFTGSYLTGVPLSSIDPAIRREAFNSLDLVLMKRFEMSKCVGTVKLKIGNLLDETDTEIFEGTDFVYRSYKPGRSFSLSFDMEF